MQGIDRDLRTKYVQTTVKTNTPTFQTTNISHHLPASNGRAYRWFASASALNPHHPTPTDTKIQRPLTSAARGSIVLEKYQSAPELTPLPVAITAGLNARSTADLQDCCYILFSDGVETRPMQPIKS
jgi:hypothetical protein